MTTGTIIAIIVACFIGAFAFYIMEQNEDLIKKNIELRREKSERMNEVIHIKRTYYIMTAEYYDDNTLNMLLEKKQKEGWEFGGINGGFIILYKSEEVKEL